MSAMKCCLNVVLKSYDNRLKISQTCQYRVSASSVASELHWPALTLMSSLLSGSGFPNTSLAVRLHLAQMLVVDVVRCSLWQVAEVKWRLMHLMNVTSCIQKGEEFVS